MNSSDINLVLEIVADTLDIPKSYYEKAADRHRSLGEWLQRPESRLAKYSPEISPQGSFLYGTVDAPFFADREYDLDNICVMNLSKSDITQKQLKEMFGQEIRDYAKTHNMQPPEEHNRCWRLKYADESISFHLDTLPCIPEETDARKLIAESGVSAHLADLAIAITDKRADAYEKISRIWPSSNPRGFAAWFKDKARTVSLQRRQQLVDDKIYAFVDEVPPYEWKTPLQRIIQILKRHRDVMFEKNPDAAPISMIITNLAARAYQGETDLESALKSIVKGIPQFVRDTKPYVPNPANILEDYADKWTKNPVAEKGFWQWHTQLQADVDRLISVTTSADLEKQIQVLFGVRLSDDRLKMLKASVAFSVAPMHSPMVFRPTSIPRPWGNA